jgi:hypothetical protein
MAQVIKRVFNFGKRVGLDLRRREEEGGIWGRERCWGERGGASEVRETPTSILPSPEDTKKSSYFESWEWVMAFIGFKSL